MSLKEKVIATAEEMVNAINTFKEHLDVLHSAVPCKEFQLAIMDAESMGEHIARFLTEGPSDPFVQVPLEDSEIPLNPATDLPHGPQED